MVTYKSSPSTSVSGFFGIVLNWHSNLTVIFLAVLSFVWITGCSREESAEEETRDSSTESEVGVAAEVFSVAPKVYEASAEQLLSARLPESESSEGWIRLFDGFTLFGWEIEGAADWSVSDQAISVTGGKESLLYTSMPWQDYELKLQYQAAASTDSGVFLRTPLQPAGSGVDCYEINLADQDKEFPTGSVVDRKKADGSSNVADPNNPWRSVTIKAVGGAVTVSINDEIVCEYSDDLPFPAGRIGLQFKQGEIQFREIKLRPFGAVDLIDEQLSSWKRYPDMPGTFTYDEGSIHVQGGRTQLESNDSFGDFILLTQYKLPTAKINSGIFFRCIPGDEMMGYECQLSNETVGNNRLSPADCGAGGIFRRQDARIVAGEVDEWSSLLLSASGPSMAAWINGVQVSNWYDDREENENPRRGLRTLPGTLMIQGHDPGTDARLRGLEIISLDPVTQNEAGANEAGDDVSPEPPAEE